MLPPLVLRPPLGPRVLRAMVLVLAGLFHIATAGWSLIANGREGDLAGAARHLLHEQAWMPTGAETPTGPLTVWLAKGSMNLFGVNEFAARLPTAVAVLVALWFILRIGEHFGGPWRGFAAGMLYLCTPGMFTLGRTLTPAPLETALLAAAFYFLLRGYEKRPERRQWYFLAWGSLAAAFFAGGWMVVAIPIATMLLLSLFHREALGRLRALLSWEGGAILAATLGAAALCGYDGLLPATTGAGPGVVAWWQLWLLFPWSVILLPAAYALLRRWTLRPARPLELEEALPLAWMAVGLTLALAFPSLFSTLWIWPPFALWGALRLEIMPRRQLLRMLAIVFAMAVITLGVTGFAKTILAALFPVIAELILGIPEFFWPSVTSVAFIAVVAFALFLGAAFWLELHHRRRFAVVALFGAMIPAGYAFADASAKFAPYFSYADFARTIAAGEATRREVTIDGSLLSASSLRFYLRLNYAIMPLRGDSPEPGGYLVTRRTRLEEWEKRSGGRLHVACQSGGSLLLLDELKKTPLRSREGD